MDIFERVAKKLKTRGRNVITCLRGYVRRLVTPVYLFPLKLVTYSLFYLVKFAIRAVNDLLHLSFNALVFPFRSLRNLIKAAFYLVVGLYVFVSFVVMIDYLTNQYGYWGKFWCSLGAKDMLKEKVVRIVGGYSEGSGFFISDNQVLTNFHVIADEPSPKIIFTGGEFVTPIKIVGDKNMDLAVLTTEKSYPDLVMPLRDVSQIYREEPLVSTGYPLGTDLSGKATILNGRFIDIRSSKSSPGVYLQTDISLVSGMSGGPLTDQCGKVVGVNTMGMAGLSIFIEGSWANSQIANFTDTQITKITVDPSVSPEEGVKAFYTYLKARRMKEGFALLSQKYLEKTNFEEWTNRFTDILDVNVISTELEKGSEDTVFVKFSTKNWINGEAEMHYYEGTWETVLEEGVYKMNKSKIKEVENPNWEWWY